MHRAALHRTCHSQMRKPALWYGDACNKREYTACAGCSWGVSIVFGAYVSMDRVCYELLVWRQQCGH